MPQPLSQVLIEACLHQADASLVLETLAHHLKSALGCQAVFFLAQQGESGEQLDAPPRFWPDASDEQGRSLDKEALALISLAALQAVRQRSLYCLPLHTHAQPDQDSGEGSGQLMAVPLEVAGSFVTVAVLVRSDQFFTQEQIALLEEARPSLALAVSYATSRRSSEQARRKQEELEAIFTASSEGILTVDKEFRVLELNPAFTTLTGWSASEAVGRTCMDVLRCCDERDNPLCKTPRCPLQQVFLSRQPIPYYEITCHDRQESRKEVTASFTAIHAQDSLRGVIIARDMTPLNAANRMRSNFISMVSHELRTPLHSINGFLSIVLEEHVGMLNERQREFLEYIHESTEQLKTLVDDILFISRADTGRFELRCTDFWLKNLLLLVLREAEPHARKLGVTLENRVSPQFPKLWADEGRIQQVLRNLINNALKFTPPDGVITVRGRQVDEMAEISISDTGCGIPFEDQSRVFERFYQSNNTLLVKHGGFGLGLTIAKLIIEQHGGHIWLQSAPEQGSTFTFTLPLFREQPHLSILHSAIAQRSQSVGE
ncbi:MAG TPA: PAS domain-containing sensor histidine kinase [Ktedonobacterales bacterium]|jgi:two-component system phosphate regulon sensor histidine kinase PhoR